MRVTQCRLTGEVIFQPDTDEERKFVDCMINMMEKGGTLSVQLKEKTLTMQFGSVFSPLGLRVICEEGEINGQQAERLERKIHNGAG